MQDARANMLATSMARGPPHWPADMHPQPPSHGRVLWNNAMVTCLLELRLGLLLPRFVGGSSSQLKDAWTALQLKFVLVTNVNLSVQQLKNKYQQLKREYTSTKQALAKRRRLARKRAAAAEAREQGGGDGNDDGDDDGDDDDDDGDMKEHNEDAIGDADEDDEDENQGEIVLPGYWDIVDKAFSGAEGYDGVEHRNRGSSSSTIKRHNKRDRDYRHNREAAAGMEDDDAEDEDSDAASSQAAETSRHQSRAGDDEDAPSDSSAPPARQRQPHPQPRNIHAAGNARPAYPVRQTPTPPSALHEFYQRMVPNGPSPPPPSYPSNMQYAPPPPHAAAAAPGPPYAYNNNPQQQYHQQPTMNNCYPFNDPNASAKKRKIDMAYALVSVGESIANAIVESARIMTGGARGVNFYPPPNRPMEGERVEAGRPTGAAGYPSDVGARGRPIGVAGHAGPARATDDLAAMMNTQIQNQVLMLKMLEKSNNINEELLQFLRQKNNNKSNSSDNNNNNSEQSE